MPQYQYGDPDPEAAALGNAVEELLSKPISDEELLAQLQQLSRARPFGGYTWLWGTEAYLRNPLRFKAFILKNFSVGIRRPPGGYNEPVPWKGEIGERLDKWFASAQAREDAVFLPLLSGWKIWGGRAAIWRRDLLRRYLRCRTSAERRLLLNLLDEGYVTGQRLRLDEPTALRLYQTDPAASARFILAHPKALWDHKDPGLWKNLHEMALQKEDDQFALDLYRRLVGEEEWTADIVRLGAEVADPQRLCDELALRWPTRLESQNVEALLSLAKLRAADVQAVLLRKVSKSRWSEDSFSQWAQAFGAVRSSEFWAKVARLSQQELIGDLLDDRSLDGPTVEKILCELGVISPQWTVGPLGGARSRRTSPFGRDRVPQVWHCGLFGKTWLHRLDDETATRIFKRFPNVLHGPLGLQVACNRRNYWSGDEYPELTAAALKANDRTLLRHLASRLTDPGGLTSYFEAIGPNDPDGVIEVARVLRRTPRRIGTLDPRRQSLKKLLYNRPLEQFLARPAAVRDLLDAEADSAQRLAFQVLSLDRDDARRLARENLDWLLAALLKPLSRTTKRCACHALNRAAVDLDSARRIVARCRAALDLRWDQHAKEEIIGLIGSLLTAWPELQSVSERPVVFGASP